MKSILKMVFIAILLIGCSQKSTKERGAAEEVTLPILKNFGKEDVAKYAISSLMNQPPEIITLKKEDNIYLVSYIRKSDGKKFNYKIKFDDNSKVVWGNSDGRWRDAKYDEEIIYSENGNKLKITQTFSDGSTTEKEFKKEE